MYLRDMGFRTLELEAGPMTFLIYGSQPVAYRDNGSYYRSQAKLGKAEARAQNKWLKDKDFASVPHAQVIEAFRGLSRFDLDPIQQAEFRVWQAERELKQLQAGR